MSHERINNHPVLGPMETRQPVRFLLDGEPVVGCEGDTIAAALLAAGIRTLRYHEESGKPRGIYCNIGHCYECRMRVDGVDGVRACLALITSDMCVERERQLPAPLRKGGRV